MPGSDWFNKDLCATDQSEDNFRMRIQKLGKFNFFTSYMSQPKFQLETFRAWAGLGSDISYYLNSHHVDLHVWAMEIHGSTSGHVTRDHVWTRRAWRGV